MDEKLNNIFSNINDWLKYAETKSATLIAGNGALIFGFSRLSLSENVNCYVGYYLIFCSFLSLISLSICLLSIIPALNMPWESKPTGRHDTDYQKDMAFQIITNSTIANRKYTYFNAAIWFTLSAVISPVITIFIYLFRVKN
jgi:hypothetical protein